jgi:hypothetical protein
MTKMKRQSKRARIKKKSTPARTYDLNVSLPETYSMSSSKGFETIPKTKRALLERLRHLGYDTIAFSHTVYGQLRPDKDVATLAISLPISTNGWSNVLRRVNVVVEDLADVGLYTGANNESQAINTTNTESTGSATRSSRNLLLNGYDIVALSPRNEATFSAACASAHDVDIIMLDYNASRGRLPYRLRPSDIRAATNLGISFELCYGSAIADPAKRKFFVQAAGEFISASATIRPKPTLILSSGNRTTPNGGTFGSIAEHNICLFLYTKIFYNNLLFFLKKVDIGTLALRSAADLTNVMKCVLGFDDRTSHDAMRRSAAIAAENRRKRSSKKCIGLPQVTLSEVCKTSIEDNREEENYQIDGFISLG